MNRLWYDMPKMISQAHNRIDLYLSTWGWGSRIGVRMWGRERSATFRERGQEAATLNPKTTPRSHAQSVFLRVLPKNQLLQHWRDKSVEKTNRFFHHKNQWGTIHGSWHKCILRLQQPISTFAKHSSPRHADCLQAKFVWPRPPEHASRLFTPVSQQHAHFPVTMNAFTTECVSKDLGFMV